MLLRLSKIVLIMVLDDPVNDLVIRGRRGKDQDWKYMMYECFVLYNKNYVLFTLPINANDGVTNNVHNIKVVLFPLKTPGYVMDSPNYE